MNAVWGYIQLIMCIGLLLMFMGSATEVSQKNAFIVPTMSEAEVSATWGPPQRTLATDSDPEGNGSTGNRSIWIYYNPYRLVVYENGVVKHCVRSRR